MLEYFTLNKGISLDTLGFLHTKLQSLCTDKYCSCLKKRSCFVSLCNLQSGLRQSMNQLKQDTKIKGKRPLHQFELILTNVIPIILVCELTIDVVVPFSLASSKKSSEQL